MMPITRWGIEFRKDTMLLMGVLVATIVSCTIVMSYEFSSNTKTVKDTLKQAVIDVSSDRIKNEKDLLDRIIEVERKQRDSIEQLKDLQDATEKSVERTQEIRDALLKGKK